MKVLLEMSGSVSFTGRGDMGRFKGGGILSIFEKSGW